MGWRSTIPHSAACPRGGDPPRDPPRSGGAPPPPPPPPRAPPPRAPPVEGPHPPDPPSEGTHPPEPPLEGTHPPEPPLEGTHPPEPPLEGTFRHPRCPFLEEVVEPAGARHVADHAVDLAALHDRHPGLRDSPRPGQGDPAAAGEVQDVDPAGHALLADPDEVLLRALEPGRHHVAVLVPAGPEGGPVGGVPGVGPGLDHVPDG